MGGYTPGDIEISEFMLSSPRGQLDLISTFIRASVFESIFHYGTVAQIYVLDTDDTLNNLKIVGDEKIKFTFRAPGGEDASFNFALHTLDKSQKTNDGMKSKTWSLTCIAEEVLNSKTNIVQKHYKTTIDNIVDDLHKTYMRSEKQLIKEATKGTQKILFSGKNPYTAIDMVRRRAVSNQNKSSSYLYFETRDGSDQVYKFSTIEDLFKKGSIKTFNMLNTVGASIYNLGHDNIIAHEIPRVFNSANRIALGLKTRVAEFNFRTWDYKTEDKTPSDNDKKTGGDGSYNSGQFKQKYSDSVKIPPTTVIPVDASSGDRPNTGIPQMTADQRNYIATLMQNAVKIKVPGDSKLKAGDVITCNFPTIDSTTGNKDNDKMLSGDFLISRIHHQILTAADKPRYTCVIEMLKGNPQEGV